MRMPLTSLLVEALKCGETIGIQPAISACGRGAKPEIRGELVLTNWTFAPNIKTNVMVHIYYGGCTTSDVSIQEDV
jgi:hypothetical protein